MRALSRSPPVPLPLPCLAKRVGCTLMRERCIRPPPLQRATALHGLAVKMQHAGIACCTHARTHARTQHTSAGTAPARTHARNMVNAHNTEDMGARAGTTRLCTRHLQAQMHVLAHTGVRRRMRAFTLAHTCTHKLHTAGRRARCDHRHALGSPLPLLHCNRAHPSDICTGTGTHPLPDIRRSAAR
jgi:hypothetical protein